MRACACDTTFRRVRLCNCPKQSNFVSKRRDPPTLTYTMMFEAHKRRGDRSTCLPLFWQRHLCSMLSIFCEILPYVQHIMTYDTSNAILHLTCYAKSANDVGRNLRLGCGLEEIRGGVRARSRVRPRACSPQPLLMISES